VILGEPITFNLIIGGLLAIMSVYIVNFKS
jgi:drug/metabolite transporter (DMT)-like permease